MYKYFFRLLLLKWTETMSLGQESVQSLTLWDGYHYFYSLLYLAYSFLCCSKTVSLYVHKVCGLEIAFRLLRCCRLLPPYVYSFFSFYKVPIRQIEGDLEKAYVSFFLPFFILWVLLSATLSYSFFLVHQSCNPNLSAAACVLKPPKHKFATLHIRQMN